MRTFLQGIKGVLLQKALRTFALHLGLFAAFVLLSRLSSVFQMTELRSSPWNPETGLAVAAGLLLGRPAVLTLALAILVSTRIWGWPLPGLWEYASAALRALIFAGSASAAAHLLLRNTVPNLHTILMLLGFSLVVTAAYAIVRLRFKGAEVAGALIRVEVAVDTTQREATIDFSGTSAQLANNFNAPRAVCMAAVLYVFRTLVDDDIPLNAGCLKPLRVIIPEGSMLNPLPPASVVAGNVETSSCITNALFGALGVMAGSQPTMNNFTFGNARYQYYETISGGSGAGGRFDERGALVGGFDGTSVVQTHMTNSRLTDPEVLEFRFPVRLRSYAIRAGSGGAGRWRGGDGGVRQVEFLEPMTASILSNGRIHPAFGLAGGQPGAPGVNRVLRADGRVEVLGHIGQAQMEAGDVFEVQTPGGGGFGAG